MKNPKVVIIDYGMGNLFSLQRVVSYLGGVGIISSDPEVIAFAQRLILPGVGAFGDGITNLQKRNLVEPIKNAIRSAKPFLGICLGMQLCMTESYEFGLHKGLNIIAGSVRKFSEPISQDKFYKVPHVGWNRLLVPKRDKEGCSCEVSTMWENTILSKVRSGEWVYFVHSYTVVPEEMAVIMSETEYGGISFCSAIHRDNIFGCQFHPEVSGETGLKILKEFLYAM